MKIAIGNDHVAVELKNIIKEHLEERGYEVVDFGTNSTERFDYPISGYKGRLRRGGRGVRSGRSYLWHGRGHQSGSQRG